MSNACTPSLVGMASPVFKFGQISLLKNIIDQNWLKKIIQVYIGVDVAYMHTNFGECDLSAFGDN